MMQRTVELSLEERIRTALFERGRRVGDDGERTDSMRSVSKEVVKEIEKIFEEPTNSN
jgi:hypothetical protein